MYRNPIPFNVAPSAPNVLGGVSLAQPGTVAPPRVFSGVTGSTGRVTNGPPGVGRVPSLNTGMTGGMSGLYNGGTPGNRSMGFGTMASNEPIPASYIIVNSQDDTGGNIAKNLHEGMLLFCAALPGAQTPLVDPSEDPLLEAPTTKPRHEVVARASRMYGQKVQVMYDLYGVNYHLEHDKHGDYQRIQSPRDVFRYWGAVGVFKNQAAPARHSYDEQPNSRMVNLIVAVRVRAFNIWGTDIFPGTRLFIICKKVKAQAGDAKRQRTSNGGRSADAPFVWKLIPYADHFKRVPPAQELLYYDEDGAPKYGAYLHVGTASERSEPYDMGVGGSTASEPDDADEVRRRADERLAIVNQMHNDRGRIPNQIEILLCI